AEDIQTRTQGRAADFGPHATMSPLAVCDWFSIFQTHCMLHDIRKTPAWEECLNNGQECPGNRRDPRGLLRLACLTGLATNELTGVPDALALVRLGWADATNACGFLTNNLLVDPDNGDAVVAFHGVADAIRWNHPHRVGVTNVEDEVLT